MLKKTSWNCIGILSWSYLLAQIFFFNFDSYIASFVDPDFLWILQFKIIIFMSLIAVSLALQGSKQTFYLFLYILFYPLIALYKLIGIRILKNWQVIIYASPAVYDYFSKFKFNFILYTLTVISIASIFNFQNHHLLLLSVIFLGLFLLIHNFRRIKSCYVENVYSKLASELSKAEEKITNTFVTTKNYKEKDISTEPVEQDNESEFFSVYVVYSGTRIFNEKLKNKTIQSYDTYLIFNFVYTYLVTLLGFAVIYFGIGKIDGMAFGVITPDFVKCLLLSAALLTGSAIEAGISPEADYLKFICVIESMYMYLFIILLGFLLFTKSRDAYKNSIIDFGNSLESLGGAIEYKVNQVFKLPIEQLELEFFNKSKYNKKIVNFVRRQRGIKEIEYIENDGEESSNIDTTNDENTRG